MAKPKRTLDNARMSLLRVAQFAEKVGVHKGTVQRWLSKDLIPFVRLPSGERRISSEVADALLHSSCKPQSSNEGDAGGR
jgi:excisionase family DNA binding protein